MEIQHELFGKLTFDSSWQGKIELPFFDETMVFDLVLDCDEDLDVLDTQRAAFNDFMQHKKRYVRQAEQAIYEHYLSICSEYRDNSGPPTSDRDAPILTEKVQLKPLLSAGGLILPPEEDERVFVLGFECTWDSSHGVGVRFVDGEIDEVGFQSDCL